MSNLPADSKTTPPRPRDRSRSARARWLVRLHREARLRGDEQAALELLLDAEALALEAVEQIRRERLEVAS